MVKNHKYQQNQYEHHCVTTKRQPLRQELRHQQTQDIYIYTVTLYISNQK